MEKHRVLYRILYCNYLLNLASWQSCSGADARGNSGIHRGNCPAPNEHDVAITKRN